MATGHGLDRRRLLKGAGIATLGLMAPRAPIGGASAASRIQHSSLTKKDNAITLFLCGDVMTGRGIDQVLPHPTHPRLYEPYVKSALDYVTLAERTNGPIPWPVDFPYIWGDALAALDRVAPDLRIINLETAVTSATAPSPKGINYKMSPDNITCLTAAAIDCCTLANNHVLDWGQAGLAETLRTLDGAGIKYAGAGADVEQAEAPVTLEVGGKGRVLVFAFGLPSSGVPHAWAAAKDKPGVAFLPELTTEGVTRFSGRIASIRKPGDIVIVSIHWGGNWGYEVSDNQREFARGLIEEAGVDIVHGHSSHHAKGIEVHQGKLILYGCGDFINDYEGIEGQEAYRGDLPLMYFVTMMPRSGRLLRLEMVPLRIRNFRLQRASEAEALWLRDMFDREGRRLGTRVEPTARRTLDLQWG